MYPASASSHMSSLNFTKFTANVSERIMICQNQSCCLPVYLWFFCVHNCYPSLFPLQNISFRVTTATAGIHYSMNPGTTHPHIKHPRRASSLCVRMENPTLLAPRWFGEGLYTTGQKTVQTPK